MSAPPPLECQPPSPLKNSCIRPWGTSYALVPQGGTAYPLVAVPLVVTLHFNITSTRYHIHTTHLLYTHTHKHVWVVPNTLYINIGASPLICLWVVIINLQLSTLKVVYDSRFLMSDLITI